MKMSLVAIALTTLPSCVDYYKLPNGYSGATAVIRNSSKPINAVKGEGYEVSHVNGKIVDASTVATPRGGGVLLMTRDTELKVPAEPLTLTLRGATIYAADGVAMADAMIGGSRNVSGPISFTPKAGGEYRVKGTLEKGNTAVWLVEEKTGKPIGQKIEKK